MIRTGDLVRAYLRITAAGFALVVVALLALPARLTTGPALDVVYQLAPRPIWGLAFAVAAGLTALASQRVGLLTALTAETAWALGLTAPIVLNRQANALAPIAWLLLAITTALVIRLRHRPPG